MRQLADSRAAGASAGGDDPRALADERLRVPEVAETAIPAVPPGDQSGRSCSRAPSASTRRPEPILAAKKRGPGFFTAALRPPHANPDTKSSPLVDMRRTARLVVVLAVGLRCQLTHRPQRVTSSTARDSTRTSRRADRRSFYVRLTNAQPRMTANGDSPSMRWLAVSLPPSRCGLAGAAGAAAVPPFPRLPARGRTPRSTSRCRKVPHTLILDRGQIAEVSRTTADPAREDRSDVVTVPLSEPDDRHHQRRPATISELRRKHERSDDADRRRAPPSACRAVDLSTLPADGRDGPPGRGRAVGRRARPRLPRARRVSRDLGPFRRGRPRRARTPSDPDRASSTSACPAWTASRSAARSAVARRCRS